MRSIFIFLLLANLAFWGISYYLTGDSVDVVQPQNASVVPGASENKLLLLSEQQTSRMTIAAATPKPVLPGGDELGSSPRLCAMVGPYEQLLHAEYLVEKLRALGVGAQITEKGIKDGEIYEVYLPPEMTEKEALRRRNELQAKNIESYVITKGELAKGVSFGRFGDLQEADAKMQAIREQGYAAQIKAVPQMIYETWVLLGDGEDEKLSREAWAELLAQQPGLEKRQNLCLGVAPN